MTHQFFCLILAASCCAGACTTSTGHSSSMAMMICGTAPADDCIYGWIYSVTGFIGVVYTAITASALIIQIFETSIFKSYIISGNRNSPASVLCLLVVVTATCCVVENAVLHHQASICYYIPQCICDEDSKVEHLICQLSVSLLIVLVVSTLGCFAWPTSFRQGSNFVFVSVTIHTISNLLSDFVISSPHDKTCDSTTQRSTRMFVMYSGILLGIFLMHLFKKNLENMQKHAVTGETHEVKSLEKLSVELCRKMNVENQAGKRSSQDLGKMNRSVFDESTSYSKEKNSPKPRWSRKKQHPFSSRFGTDSFLPCVVLMKKEGQSSLPVAVNVSNIGPSATKPAPPRHAYRRASLEVVKERGGGDDAATWARLSQRRRTSLPTTFHSSRKQTVMSSVLIESSVVAELHATLNELSVATSSSNIQVEKCTDRMLKCLKPYKNENLCPSQVVWLHDSISSTSDGSDDEESVRGSRGSFTKRNGNRRHERNPDNVFTTTTSATGLPSQDPGPVNSKRLPKIQKTPSNTPHDSRCSSPTIGKEIGSLSRRKTIHNIGPPRSPGRSQTFFSQDDSNAGKDGRRIFPSSDYESCDNILTDCSEGETVKQMPDLQQPNTRRGVETSSHDPEQSPKIRMLITEPTIDEGSEEEICGSDCSSESCDTNGTSAEKSRKSSSAFSVHEDDGSSLAVDEVQRFFNSFVYKSELLEKVYSWNFPIFELADATHCVLSQMAYKLFDDTGLFETFKIPLKPFVDYMRALENGYRNIPYHNRIHASDVLHGCWFLTTQQISGFSEFSPLLSSDSSDYDSGTAHTQINTVAYGSLAQAIPALELMALYLAAAMHDYDHPGRTNAFLVETRHPLAMLYNDRSVLENHHASASWELLHSTPAYNFLKNLDVPEWKRLRFLIVEAILATDLKKHFELMSKFSSKLARRTDTCSEAAEPLRHEGCLKWSADEDRLLVCQMVIKLADIGGPTKIRDLHVTWTKAICQEFYTQGDEERQRETPVSPFMDREKPQVAQLQRTFIKNLIAPLVCKMHRAGILAGYIEGTGEREEENILEPTEDGSAAPCLSLIRVQLADNLRYWQAILQREMDGHREMEEVFKCCHSVTLEHDVLGSMKPGSPKSCLGKTLKQIQQ